MEVLEANISQAMSRANRLYFNLDQMKTDTFRQFAKNPSFTPGNITNWELQTILRNPSLLNKTTFFGPAGEAVPPPSF